MKRSTSFLRGKTWFYLAGCTLGLSACEGSSRGQADEAEQAGAEGFGPGAAGPEAPAESQPSSGTPAERAPGEESATTGLPEEVPGYGSEAPGEQPGDMPGESPATGTETTSPDETEPAGADAPVADPGESLTDPAATAPDAADDQTPTGSQGIPAPTGSLPGDGTASPLFGGWETPAAPQPWAIQPVGEFPNELPLQPGSIAPETLLPAWTTGRRLAIHGDSLLVCVPEVGTLVELARDSGQLVRSIALGGRPEQVVVAADGTAYVTLRQSGSVVRIDPGAATSSGIVSVGTEPFGLALSVDGSLLYVSASGDDSLVVLSVPDLQIQGTYPAGFRPRTVAVGLDNEVFVTNERGALTVVSAAVVTPTIQLRKVNPGDLTIHTKLQPNTPGIPNRAFGVAIHPISGDTYVPHTITRPGTRESESEKLNPPQTGTVCKPPTFCPNPGGYGSVVCNPVCEQVNLVFPRTRRPIEWTVSVLPRSTTNTRPASNALPIKHAQTAEPMTAICDKPMDAIHHPSMSLLFVVCEGTDNVMVLNTNASDPMTAILGEIRVGEAPRGIVLTPDGATGYVANSQGFSVGRIDINGFVSALVKTNRPGSSSDNFFPPTFSHGTTVAPATTTMVAEAVYAADPIKDDVEKLGRRAYTFARFQGLSANGFFACATCHIEGADDGLTWFVSDGPRQTPMLAQRLHGTAPFNWIGTAPTLPDNVVNTVSRMGGTGIGAEAAEGIAQFLLGANGPVAAPNKFLSPSGLTAEQKAGQALFFNPVLGCSTCHSGSALTDGKSWDVGTFSDLEMELRAKHQTDAPLALNTPSLRGLYYSPPYMHDGTSATLRDVLTNTATTMGHSFMLTKVQQDQLISYLLTL